MSQENRIAQAVVECAYEIHSKLGPGLLESVYQRVLSYELRKRGFKVESEVSIPLIYDGHTIDEAFRADLIVDQLVIIELKSIEQVQPIHKKQLITYLKLSDKKLGLLINFGSTLIKDGITRLVNGL